MSGEAVYNGKRYLLLNPERRIEYLKDRILGEQTIAEIEECSKLLWQWIKQDKMDLRNFRKFQEWLALSSPWD